MPVNNQTTLCLTVRNAAAAVVCTAQSAGQASLQMPRAWQPGDEIVLAADRWPVCLRLSFDPHVPEAEVWLAGPQMVYPIPFGEERMPYAPDAFAAPAPTLCARTVAAPVGRYDVSTNPLDRRGPTACYPHCTATAETRGESVFAARNTIDGLCDNTSHGHWPYESWGDNEDPTAEIMVEFGRPVRVDTLQIWLRADFPHDNWWQSGTLDFSDGSSETLTFQKTGVEQVFAFAPRTVTWAKLRALKPDPTDPSPWPSLRQWRFWGQN